MRAYFLAPGGTGGTGGTGATGNTGSSGTCLASFTKALGRLQLAEALSTRGRFFCSYADDTGMTMTWHSLSP